jgi:hypothetical protein
MRVGVGDVGEKERGTNLILGDRWRETGRAEVTYVSQLVRYAFSFLVTLIKIV